MTERSTAGTSPCGPAPRTDSARILLVDTEEEWLRSLARSLSASGCEVECASSGAEAIRVIARRSFDAVVCELAPPLVDGWAVAGAVRARDPDVPLIVTSASPSTESVMQAMEVGALRYLVKPAPVEELAHLAREAARGHQVAVSEREALAVLGGASRFVGDHAGLSAQFASALSSLWMAFQPIVSNTRRETYGYEALLRSVESSLATPDAVLHAAERLDRVHPLGRTIRGRVVAAVEALPPAARLFVNLHPRDVLDEELYDRDSPFSRFADRIVLELTEREALEGIPDLQQRVRALRTLGFQIAIDDVGAGYAGLSSLSLLSPDIVKVDMSLIRDIDTSPTKRRLVAALAGLCRDLDIVTVAEGIETPAERDTVVDLGIDLLQGFLFARPGRPFPRPTF